MEFGYSWSPVVDGKSPKNSFFFGPRDPKKRGLEMCFFFAGLLLDLQSTPSVGPSDSMIRTVLRQLFGGNLREVEPPRGGMAIFLIIRPSTGRKRWIHWIRSFRLSFCHLFFFSKSEFNVDIGVLDCFGFHFVEKKPKDTFRTWCLPSVLEVLFWMPCVLSRHHISSRIKTI